MEERGEIDTVSLTMPNEQRLANIARILVGGLAARLDVSYESLDDLQLAVESVLADGAVEGENVTIELTVRERALDLLVAPVSADALDPGRHSAEGIDLRVLLEAVVDGAAIEERDGVRWLRLAKRVPFPARA